MRASAGTVKTSRLSPPMRLASTPSGAGFEGAVGSGRVKPGGAVLCYDFTVDNPRNRDVRGVPVARLRELFPQGRVSASRVTLAPPLARVVCRAHPSLYTVFNWLPLRTHVLAWIDKPAPLAEPQDPE